MNHEAEAESSTAHQRRHEDVNLNSTHEDEVDEREAQRVKDQLAKERRLDAKRKRIRMLNELLRELDLAVYMELITVYQLDCSFFWLAIRALIHGSLLTPMADPVGERPPDQPKPFLPLVLFSFLVNFVLHQTYPAPSAGEDTRGYLHGGLMIDFIGQQGPTGKWKLGALDLGILLLQLIMVSVHIKRREVKKKMAKLSAGTGAQRDMSRATPGAPGEEPTPPSPSDNAGREQNADGEERGLLHRTDTLSDLGGGDTEEDDAAVLAPSAEVGQADALDILTSGQCIIGDFSLIDTLLQENRNYSAYRLTRSESGINEIPEPLRRLHSLRTRFGVGGG